MVLKSIETDGMGDGVHARRIRKLQQWCPLAVESFRKSRRDIQLINYELDDAVVSCVVDELEASIDELAQDLREVKDGDVQVRLANIVPINRKSTGATDKFRERTLSWTARPASLVILRREIARMTAWFVLWRLRLAIWRSTRWRRVSRRFACTKFNVQIWRDYSLGVEAFTQIRQCRRRGVKTDAPTPHARCTMFREATTQIGGMFGAPRVGDIGHQPPAMTCERDPSALPAHLAPRHKLTPPSSSIAASSQSM